MASRKEWGVKASQAAKNTVNPLRAITDRKNETNPAKDVISLSIGDPTVYGNLGTHEYVREKVKAAVDSHKYDGYPPSTGYEAARTSVAKYYSTPEAPVGAADIILASGASGALEIAFTALINPGENILIPLPAFSLYDCISTSKGFEVRRYKLLPERNWEADIEHMRSLIDDKTRAILVNNPSNPCGCVYSKEHLEQILAVADEFKVPIISDEIYADMAFSRYTFYPLASLTKSVPILTIGGLAKRFLIPGWRVGWIIIHDRNDILKEVRPGMNALTQLILGPNSLIQSTLPDILHNTPKEFFEATNKTLEDNANFAFERVSRIPGLKPIRAQGAMYEMIEIEISKMKDIENDIDFMRKLLAEESVFVLPGNIFNCPNFFRIVTCPPKEKLEIAFTRMEEFCKRHAK